MNRSFLRVLRRCRGILDPEDSAIQRLHVDCKYLLCRKMSSVSGSSGAKDGKFFERELGVLGLRGGNRKCNRAYVNKLHN